LKLIEKDTLSARALIRALKSIEFVQMFLNNCSTDFVPTCHNIVYKLIKTFVIARIHFTLKKKILILRN